MSRNSVVLASFVAYCKAHPDERFWQALRNWCGKYNFIYATSTPLWDIEELNDTFYWEGRQQ
jgi:hypothetical protein